MLDDPKKNYLRRVETADVRVPSRDTLRRVVMDAGWDFAWNVYAERSEFGHFRYHTSDSMFLENTGMVLAVKEPTT